MRPSSRFLFAAASLVVFAGVSQAQFVGGFGQRTTVGFQVRTGPYNSLTYVAGAYSSFGPIYGPIPTWYYGQPGIPIINNPFVVQPPVTPPIVINNFIPGPGGQVAPPVPGRLPFAPPEGDVPQMKAPPKAPKGKAPVARAVAPELAPEPPKGPPAVAGQADADRVAETGRKAFTAGQYGRAAELFRRTVEITPNEPSAHYLVSQAQFARGKYREAIAAIRAGIAVRTDWAEARFVSRDLYWKTPELFDEHLNALRQSVADFPNDAGLTFLLGHQLWFDGKHAEATALFQKASALAKGQTPAETFLAK